MGMFSFDIESTYDVGEMNNVYDQAQKELINRYDLKGTQASLEWIDDKKGVKICGDNQYHLDAIIELLRKKAAVRGVSQKTFDTSKEPETTNLRMIWIVPFKNGLKSDDAKKITKLLRDELPKVKTQIQGDTVRVMSGKKDELQSAMQLLKSQDFDFPLLFTNFR
ncbi:YajQ family cyclic di-GMP-binding protein [Candidatus Saccharibacteria bacterium]|nr:YajQ family cyclic di-GMP-binding protein [Candidatus Saccharibacteria bacterium]